MSQNKWEGLQPVACGSTTPNGVFQPHQAQSAGCVRLPTSAPRPPGLLPDDTVPSFEPSDRAQPLTGRTQVSYSAARADFDGDGDEDLALCHHRRLELWMNHGNGTFERVLLFETLSGNPTALAWADVDADGDMDLFAGYGCYEYPGQTDRRNVLLLNHGVGNFTVVEDTTTLGIVADDTVPTCGVAFADGAPLRCAPSLTRLSDPYRAKPDRASIITLSPRLCLSASVLRASRPLPPFASRSQRRRFPGPFCRNRPGLEHGRPSRRV
jgi:hypothetical protein